MKSPSISLRRRWEVPRRHFLRGLGACLALPALEVMGAGTKARASASGSAPRRFVTVFQPNGAYPAAWDVEGTGSGYRLSPLLEPLERHRDSFSLVSGLDNQGHDHVQLTSAFLSSVPVRGGRAAPSLDQQIAALTGRDTPLPSIELGTEPPRQGNASGNPIAYANTISWRSESVRLAPETHPQAAFDRLFRTAQGAIARQAALKRQSVLDLVSEDADRLRKRVSGSDRDKLDQYLQSVREVEQRLERVIDPPARSWHPPTRPELTRPGAGMPADHAEHLDLMMELAVLGLWTDTTRVATVMTASGFSIQDFSFLDGVDGEHHAKSHHNGDLEMIRQYNTITRWYVGRFARFLDRMAEVDEGGESLLDHSTVLYGSGMKDGNGHHRRNVPLILAGRGGGLWRPGRHVAFEEGTPLADFHLTLARAHGLELEAFNGVGQHTLEGLS